MRKPINSVLILLVGVTLGYLGAIQWTEVSAPQVCFTPTQRCQPRIVLAFQQARSEILVQAYSLTAEPIIKELARAQERGVRVRIIGDAKTNNAKYIQPVKEVYYKERLSGLAHNKVIIVDRKKVFTGSYNFSHAAEYRNAENLVEINNPHVAGLYRKNWKFHCRRAKGCN